MDLTGALSKVTEAAVDEAVRQFGKDAAATLDQVAEAVPDVEISGVGSLRGATRSGADFLRKMSADGADRPTQLRSGASPPMVGAGAPAPRATQVKPVFQMSALPLTVNPASYANPVTNSNPRGDYKSLFAFRALVDPVPGFARYYTPVAGSSTELLWGDLINGASVSGEATYVRQVLGKAQQLFSTQLLSNLGGVPGEWRPVYATPEDWFDFSIPGRFQDIEIDLGSPDSAGAAFATIGGNTLGPQLNWVIAQSGSRPTAMRLDPKTNLKKLRFKALAVSLTRPWFDFSILKVNGIYLQGQDIGLYSSGQLDGNDGVLPLLPSNFLLAKDIEIEADWAPTDLQVVAHAQQNDARIALGQFALSSGESSAAGSPYTANFANGVVSSSAVQLVSWISTLVPLCPRSTS
jgi:hypothetical protein